MLGLKFLRRAGALAIAAAVLLCALGCANSAIVRQSGPLRAEIVRLKSLVFPKESGLYVRPDARQLADFRALAASVVNGSYDAAALQANALGYELVDFFDTETSRRVYLLRERLNAQGGQSLGWGNYIWNPSEQSDVLVEAPHPLYDPNTPEFAVEVFQKIGARGFLMAGAHRSQDGQIYGIANVAGQVNCIFEVVHETWSRATTLPIQIHGFDYDKHKDFPKGTDVILSNCDGAAPQVLRDLDRAFAEARILSYVYNTLDAKGAVNAELNGDLPGRAFISLSGNYNVQGAYTHKTYGAPFVHCEMSRDIRINKPELWKAAMDAICRVLLARQTPPVPAGKAAAG